MIKINFFKNGIDVEGHANFSLKGNDIVCAAISGVFLTGINWFDHDSVSINKETKENKISFRLKDNSNKNKVALSVIKFQLGFIAKNYPKMIMVVNNEK